MSDTTNIDHEASLRMAAGRAEAMRTLPYFGDALFAMKPVMTRELDTCAVDKRWRVYYNPEFIMSLPLSKVVGAWLHELGHVLHDHTSRWDALNEPNGRHPVFNCAGDAAINAILRDANVTLPAIKAYFPERIAGADRNSSTEKMYRLLLDTPEGRAKIKAEKPLVLTPSAVGVRNSGFTIVATTASANLTSDATVTVTDQEGTKHDVTYNVVGDRIVSFSADDDLPAGQYQVVVECGGESADAILAVVPPQMQVRPDHLPTTQQFPAHIVLEGQQTHFGDDTQVVVSDKDGNTVFVPTETKVVSRSTYTFSLDTIPAGAYVVTATTGDESVSAALPVGLPYLELNPASLTEGFGTPYPLAAVVEDTTMDSATTFHVLQPSLMGFLPVENAMSVVKFKSATTADVTVDVELDAGSYLVIADGPGGSASTTLTVSPADGQSQGGDGGRSSEDESSEDGDSGDCGSGSGGGSRPWEEPDTDEANNDGSVSEARADIIRSRTAQAIKEHAKGVGNVPGGLERWADTILSPQVDWRTQVQIIARGVAAHVAGQHDYSYARPNVRRMHAAPGVILPILRAPNPPMCDVITDTSASVSDAALGQMLGELEGIMRAVGGAVRVRPCDAAAAPAQRVASLSGLKIVGGGGTDMRVGIAAAAEDRPKSDLIITMTDGGTPWPTERPAANPRAKYVALIVDEDVSFSTPPPEWMTVIKVDLNSL